MKIESFYLSGEKVQAKPFRYCACGLDGIYLLNGYALQMHDDEEHVSITDVGGLHKAIGRHIVMYRKALAPKEVRFLRNTMNLTQAELAETLGNTSQSVARWEKGECMIPGASEKLLRVVYLASLLTEEELKQLQQMLVSGLDELDEMDETSSPLAQFELLERWEEKQGRMVAA